MRCMCVKCMYGEKRKSTNSDTKGKEKRNIKIRKVCSSVFKPHLHVKKPVLTRKGHSNNHMGYLQSKRSKQFFKFS